MPLCLPVNTGPLGGNASLPRHVPPTTSDPELPPAPPARHLGGFAFDLCTLMQQHFSCYKWEGPHCPYQQMSHVSLRPEVLKSHHLHPGLFAEPLRVQRPGLLHFVKLSVSACKCPHSTLHNSRGHPSCQDHCRVVHTLE